MTRTYRITLVLEATYARKVNVRDSAVRMAARAAGSPWALVSTAIRSRVDRPPAAPKPQTPVEASRATVLARCRFLADEVRRCDPTLRRVAVRWVDRASGGCGSPSRRATAHAHQGRSARYDGPRRKYVRLPRNLICLHPRLLRVLERETESAPGWDSDAYFADLMAHEIAHMNVAGRHPGRHGVRADEAFAKWKAFRAGTFTPPVRTAPKSSAPDPNPSEGST